MRHYKKCVEYCDQILDKDKTNTIILDLRKDSMNEQKLKERNERKKELEEKRRMKNEENLISEIIRRGYRLEGDSTSKFQILITKTNCIISYTNKFNFNFLNDTFSIKKILYFNNKQTKGYSCHLVKHFK